MEASSLSSHPGDPGQRPPLTSDAEAGSPLDALADQAANVTEERLIQQLRSDAFRCSVKAGAAGAGVDGRPAEGQAKAALALTQAYATLARGQKKGEQRRG